MLNNHTQNQRRMYRIHKMEEQIKKDEYIIGSQQQQLDKYKNVIDKIDKLINTDYGWVSYYYKYNNKYLKSEIKEDINELLEEVE